MLFLSFLSFPVSSGLLYFSWEFFNLYLFILEESDCLVSIFGLRPLPAEDLPKIIMFIVPDREQRGWQQ